MIDRYSGAFIGTIGGEVDVANPRAACLVLGGPGAGKTQVCFQSVARAPAACVSTSVKTELLAETAAVRKAFGKCWWFDPGGAGGKKPHKAIKRLRWNPLVDVCDWDSARSVASRLTGPARQETKDAHWVDRAESCLSVFLFVAAVSNRSLEILASSCREPLEYLNRAGEALEAMSPADPTNVAAARSIEYAAGVVSSLLAAPEKELGSIVSTVARIMNIYNSPAAVAAGENPNFDPHRFVRSADTVYISAPKDKQDDMAPLVVGLLESIRLAQYQRAQNVQMGRETQEYPVTFVLDEAANTAKLPIPGMASETGGQGLHMVVALQDLAQAREQWGQAADGFLTLFPDIIVFGGIRDRQTVDTLSAMSGEHDVEVESFTPGHRTEQFGPGTLWNKTTGYSETPDSVSYSTRRERILPVEDISGVDMGWCIHFSRPNNWAYVDVPLWDDTLEELEAEAAREAEWEAREAAREEKRQAKDERRAERAAQRGANPDWEPPKLSGGFRLRPAWGWFVTALVLVSIGGLLQRGYPDPDQLKMGQAIAVIAVVPAVIGVILTLVLSFSGDDE